MTNEEFLRKIREVQLFSEQISREKFQSLIDAVINGEITIPEGLRRAEKLGAESMKSALHLAGIIL